VRAGADLPGVPETAAFIGKTLTAPDGEARARTAVEKLALLAATAALAEGAPASVAQAFARTRLAEPRYGNFGTADLEPAETVALLERALPA
jgi:putative acyl-CoA dehydrogenase